MALAPVQLISDFMEGYPNFWLKFYEQGTTTPLAMAIDSTGSPTAAKAEISLGPTPPLGLIKTAGNVTFIPYLDQAYDAYIFPTEAEADANDTANAIQLADDVSFLQNLPNSVAGTLVADMIANTDLSIGDFVDTVGYATAGDGGDNAYLAQATTGGPYDGGSLIASTGNPAIEFVGLFPGKLLNVQQFGALGSGDDTAEIQAALDYLALNGGTLRNSSSTHTVSDKLTCNPTKSIEISGPITLNYSAVEIDIGLHVNAANAIDEVLISDMEMSCGNIVATGIFVDDGFGIAKVSVKRNTTLDLSNVTVSRSATGIRVDAGGASIVDIEGNSVIGVNRIQVNPGVISSSGISVNNASGLITISGNAVEDISSPSGDADADGVVVFGAQNGAPTVLDSGKVLVENNDFKDCKGRFVKFQHTNATANNNRAVISDGSVLILNWRYIDFQNSNGICTNNELEYGSTVTADGGGAVSTAFVRFANQKDLSTKKVSMCSGNVLKTSTTWAQVIISNILNGNTSILIHDNDFGDANTTVLHIGNTGDFVTASYSIHDNILDIGSILFDVFSDQTWANLFVGVTDNQNIDTLTGHFRQVFPTGGTFSLESNFVLGGNKTMIERVEWVFDFNRLNQGCAFQHGSQVNTNRPFAGEGHVLTGGLAQTAIPANALARWQRVIVSPSASTWTTWNSVVYS